LFPSHGMKFCCLAKRKGESDVCVGRYALENEKPSGQDRRSKPLIDPALHIFDIDPSGDSHGKLSCILVVDDYLSLVWKVAVQVQPGRSAV